ncbi:hypothetical protein [Streptosporangium longisporum]|uniref:ABC transporter n=1 Tax=Streptosporangium longisporum TaxID=46187 RepID=A0ABP6KIP8_9ACTN
MTTAGVRTPPARPAPGAPPLLALLRPLVRATDWTPLAVAAPLTTALAAVVQPGEPVDPRLGLLVLRASAMLLGTAAAFALVDAMDTGTAATPVPRWIRQWTRTLMAAALAAAGWGVTYAIVTVRLAPGDAPPLPGTAVEAAGCVLAALAGAALAVRRHPGRQAALAGAAVLLALTVAARLPGSAAWPEPGDPRWDVVHAWWSAALPLPVLVLAWAHRDARERTRRTRA